MEMVASMSGSAFEPRIVEILKRRVEKAEGGWLFGSAVDFYRPFRRACRAAVSRAMRRSFPAMRSRMKRASTKRRLITWLPT